MNYTLLCPGTLYDTAGHWWIHLECSCGFHGSCSLSISLAIHICKSVFHVERGQFLFSVFKPVLLCTTQEPSYVVLGLRWRCWISIWLRRVLSQKTEQWLVILICRWDLIFCSGNSHWNQIWIIWGGDQAGALSLMDFSFLSSGFPRRWLNIYFHSPFKNKNTGQSRAHGLHSSLGKMWHGKSMKGLPDLFAGIRWWPRMKWLQNSHRKGSFQISAHKNSFPCPCSSTFFPVSPGLFWDFIQGSGQDDCQGPVWNTPNSGWVGSELTPLHSGLPNQGASCSQWLPLQRTHSVQYFSQRSPAPHMLNPNTHKALMQKSQALVGRSSFLVSL